MKLKHIVIAAAAAVALPAFAEHDPQPKQSEVKSGRTVAEVRAEARGTKFYGEAGVPFDFSSPSTRTRSEVRAEARNQRIPGEAGIRFDSELMSMLSREMVRAELMARGSLKSGGA